MKLSTLFYISFIIFNSGCGLNVSGLTSPSSTKAENQEQTPVSNSENKALWSKDFIVKISESKTIEDSYKNVRNSFVLSVSATELEFQFKMFNLKQEKKVLVMDLGSFERFADLDTLIIDSKSTIKVLTWSADRYEDKFEEAFEIAIDPPSSNKVGAKTAILLWRKNIESGVWEAAALDQ